MTPEEKAKELYRFYIDFTFGAYNCQQCCLLAVDEILLILNKWSSLHLEKSNELIFWEDVKQELESYEIR